MSSCGTRPPVSKHILYIITTPDLGGAQTHVLALLNGFKDAHNVQLMTSKPGPLATAAAALGIEVFFLPSLARNISPIHDYQAVETCRRLLEKLRPDMVHLHSSKAGAVGRLAARAAGIPAVFTAHGWGFKPGVPLARRLVVWMSERLLAPLTRTIVCVSQYDRILAARYGVGRRTPLITIRNGIEDCSPPEGSGVERVTIGMVARFQEPKDHRSVLRAVARLHRADLRLVFAGDGPEQPRIEALAHAMGIGTQVEFRGACHDVATLLGEVQILVLASRYEGLPISILEGMRAGLPVVASAVGGVPELVVDGATGYLTAQGDVAALAGALARLVDDPVLRRAQGQAGRARFLEHFTAARMLRETAAVYEAVR